MQHYQSKELNLTAHNTGSWAIPNQTSTHLISVAPVFIDDLSACFDSLLECALHNKSWLGPLLRIGRLLGAEPSLIEAPGTQPLCLANKHAKVEEDGSIQPYIIEAQFGPVTVHFGLNFRETISEQTSPNLATLVAIKQHFQRCLMVLVWRWRAPDTQTALHALVSTLSTPYALVDHDNQLISINSAGRATFGLQSEEPWINNPNWRAALARAKSDVGGQAVFLAGEMSFALRAMRVASSLGNTTLANCDLYLVEISKAPCSMTQALELVRQRYNLSKNEAAVLSFAVTGDGVDQIAKRRGVSRETIRAQLRACRSKTNTNSLFQLICLVNGTLTDQKRKCRASQIQTHELDHQPRFKIGH